MAVTPKGEEKSRDKLYAENDVPVPYPERWSGSYLVESFFEVGPTNGDHPINWVEIDAYSRLTGYDFEPWEAKTLHEMSRAFIDEYRNGTSPLSIEPLERDYDGGL